MKRVLFVFILILSVIVMFNSCGCSVDDPETSSGNGEQTTIPEYTYEGKMPTDRYNYKMDECVELFDLNDSAYMICYDDVQKAIDRAIIDNSTLPYKAKIGDSVKVDITFYDVSINEGNAAKGNKIESISVNNFEIESLGNDIIYKEVEEKVIGLTLGEELTVLFEKDKSGALPNDSVYGEYAGQSAYVTIKLLSKKMSRGDIVVYTSSKDDQESSDYLYAFIGSQLSADENMFEGKYSNETFEKTSLGANYKYAIKGIIDPQDFDIEYINTYFDPEAKSYEEFLNNYRENFVKSDLSEIIVSRSTIINYPEKERNTYSEFYDVLDNYFKNNKGSSYSDVSGFTREEYIKNSMSKEMIFYAFLKSNNIEGPTESEWLEKVNELYPSIYSLYSQLMAGERAEVIEKISYESVIIDAYNECVVEKVLDYIYENYHFPIIEKTYISVSEPD